MEKEEMSKKIENIISESTGDLTALLMTLLADDELFNLAFNYMNFKLLEKVVPEEYLLVRYVDLKRRGLIKKLSEEK